MPPARATTVALVVSFLSLMVTLVSLSVIMLAASNQGSGECASQMPNGSTGEQAVQPTPVAPVTLGVRQANPPSGQASPVNPVATPLRISAPKEIADYAVATIEQEKCRDCQCTDINLVRAAIKPLTAADNQSQITDAWCFEVYYSKKVCKWEGMATTLSIRKVRGQLQAAEMGWGEFERCLSSGP